MLAILVLLVVLMSTAGKSAPFDQHDTARMSDINEAITALENDVRGALHGVARDDAETIEAYSYVALNLEAAQERLNGIFLLVVISMFMSEADQLAVVHLTYSIVPPSKAYITEKKEAIASMALAHPASAEFAAYSTRADAILGGLATSLLDELYRRMEAFRPQAR